MTLKAQVSLDIIQAMRDKDKLKKGVLTVLKAAIQNEEIRLKQELTKDDELTILNRERKQTKDSLFEYEKADRQDLVEQEKQKIVIIEAYLPKQLTEADLITILTDMNLSKDTQRGPIIGQLNKAYKGQIEGKVVSKVVIDFLTNL